jgi:hypothetical protein
MPANESGGGAGDSRSSGTALNGKGVEGPRPPSTTDRVAAYLRDSVGPLPSAAVILPLALVFEIGRWLQASGAGAPDLVAERAIEALLAILGPAGQVAPIAALCAALLVWWRVQPGGPRARPDVCGLMLVEGLLLSTPLFVLHRLFEQEVGGRSALYGLGGGVYEEFAFRWLLTGGIWLGLRQVRALPPHLAMGLAVVLGALAFSSAHLQPVGGQAWSAAAFWLRFLSGAYLGIVFVGRGIAPAIVCHAAFNVLGAALG